MDPGPVFPTNLATFGVTRLARLLRSRPDLADPVPRNLTELVQRASRPASVLAALRRLDDRALRVVIGLAAGADPEFLDLAAGNRLTAVLGQLAELGLVGGTPPRLGAAVVTALGPNPGGLARPSRHPIPADELAGLLAELPAAECRVLARLVWGPATGRLRNAERVIGTGTARGPVERLLVRGLLRPVAADTVELPREVALLLRTDRRFWARPALPGGVPGAETEPVRPLDVPESRRVARTLLTTGSGPGLLAQAHSQDRWVALEYAAEDGLTHRVVVRVLTIGQGMAWLVRRHGRRLNVPLNRVVGVRLGKRVVISDLGSETAAGRVAQPDRVGADSPPDEDDGTASQTRTEPDPRR